MPYQLSWLIEERVIYAEFQGRITVDELKAFIADVTDYIESGTPLVHLITNSLHMEKVDMSLATLQTLASAYELTDQLGWTIDINRHPILRMFAGLAVQFANVRQRTVKTIQEAVNFLRTNDDTLRDVVWHLPAEEESPLL